MSAAKPHPLHWGISAGAFRIFRGNRELRAIADPREALEVAGALLDPGQARPAGFEWLLGARSVALVVADLMKLASGRA